MSGTTGAAEQLFGSLSARSKKAALEIGGQAIAYGQLDSLSARFAGSLAAHGVGPGDAVAVRTGTCPEAVVALLGILRAGAVHVPLNPAFTDEETRHVLTDSGSKLTIAHGGGDGPLGKQLAFGEILAKGSPAPSPDVELPDEAIALLLYTSGTTGASKGVELSLGAVVSNLSAVTNLWKITEGDRVVMALPLFHVHGLGLGVIGSLLHGATVLLLDAFEPSRIIAAFQNEGATLFMGVPTMYVRLLEHLRRDPAAGAALSKGRLFTSGSAPLAAADFTAFREATGHAVLERYGMTETLFTLSNPFEGERRPGTVGHPVPGCRIRIVDDEGRDVAHGEAGELLVRGNGLMTRYRNRPEETRASFREGWFLTGDVATQAADGYVTLHGRKTLDFVKSGGYRISTREIEEVLSRHPRVREVAVIGLPDRVWGQRVVAAVTLRPAPALPGAPGGSPDSLEGDLARLAESALAPYKRPREIVILDELPRNSLGKVQKPRLAQRLVDRPNPS